ncbi:Muconate cycloisomerase 1 [Fulvia fulva]|uniref:Muconate cycloisomerase 1 n=1 Tax=Passalora fulva TaxID=5499 RepID=A0A9Q8LHR7_PASFU|nr:Muconate cycloisomerase 1 [Fulvia fulva]UJO17871.1 Muconate cycloisomerase 1 [Fulvia fulva]WPV15359.1 Muconate cycloisomerase 1 [Fulvia fulva]
MDFIVGSFNHSSLYLLQFTPASGSNESSLKVIREHPAIAGHSWLSLSQDKKFLYCTAWLEKPAIAAYRVGANGRDIQFLNAKNVKALSGYVCSNQSHVFSAGGPSGEVFRREADGTIGDLVQELDYVSGQGENQSEKRGDVAHGSFGGLRHGAHSVDLSPDGESLYVADIGRNCIWTYKVIHSKRGISDPPLELSSKHISPREHDGPRHTWPHPNGKVLYSLQEHSSMVDVFAIAEDGVTLEHKQGCSVLPSGKDCKKYWADEVRHSTGPDPAKPRYLYASNRGLDAGTMGHVAAYKLKDDGFLKSEDPIDIFETPTSGGLANAVEPAPWTKHTGDEEYLALTDSQDGWVSILSFDGKKIKEVSKVNLGKTNDGKVVTFAWQAITILSGTQGIQRVSENRTIEYYPNNIVIGTVRDISATQARLSKDGITSSNIHLLPVEITNAASVQKAAQDVAAITGGSLDFLIQNAALVDTSTAYKSVLDLDPQELGERLKASFDPNVVGTAYVLSYFIPLIRQSQGKKVLVTSTGMADLDIINKFDLEFAVPYSVSKAAMNLLVGKYHAAVGRSDGILVFSVSPGFVDTSEGKQPTEEELKGMQAMGAKFATYTPDFSGPITVGESVGDMAKLLKRATVDEFGGGFVSQKGDKKWL